MTVGTCAGIPLQDSEGVSRHGGVFLLREAPITDATVTLLGWTTTVSVRHKAVVTYGPSTATNFDNARSEALRAANNCLDYMCMRGWCDSVIRLDSDECIAWWADPTLGVVLRARTIHTIKPRFRAEGTVTTSSGEVVPSPPPPTLAQHDAFRFIRMARTSEYLFDSYRNMFLALERLLSDIRPRKMKANGKPDESEKAWFTDALKKADALAPVAALAPTGELAPIDWVYENMYGDKRSALMHAKPGLYRLPQDDVSRDDLRDSLHVLWDFVRHLVGKLLDVEYGFSGFSSAGWDWFIPFDDMVLYVADRDLADLSDQAVEATLRDHVIKLDASAPVAEEPLLRTRVGMVAAGALETLNGILQLGAMTPSIAGPIAFASELPGPLLLGGSVERFELQAGVRGLNSTDMPNFSA